MPVVSGSSSRHSQKRKDVIGGQQAAVKQYLEGMAAGVVKDFGK